MTLTKGKDYKKSDFGIKFPKNLYTSTEINGEYYFFVTIGDKFNNAIINGELIVEPRIVSEIVKHDTQENRIVHAFVRTLPKKEFTYLGDVDWIKQHDPKRNLLTLK